MSRKNHLEPLNDLPPELAELDQELSELFLEERPSFGPELRNQLARAHAAPRPPARYGWVRYAAAAALAGVMVAGVAVPPARASLIEGIQALVDRFGSTPEPEVVFPTQVTVAPEQPQPEPVPENPASVSTDRADAPPPVEAEEGRLPVFQPTLSSFPALEDQAQARELVRSYYPMSLQRQGIGGTAHLMLWVDPSGSVDNVQLAGSSGLDELDRAAVAAASALRFEPAVRNGVAVGTWVEFDLVFDASTAELALETPAAVAAPVLEGMDVWSPDRDWEAAAVIPAPVLLESRELLRLAMGGDAPGLEARFGPLEGILSGDSPAGEDPLTWRTRVTEALEEATLRDPENPAPYLALARIRRKQGLRADAHLLFREGLALAARGSRPVSPRLTAELAYESGRLARENWLGWRGLGELPAEALSSRACPGAAAPVGPVADASVLVAWNFSCTEALDEALDRDFRVGGEGPGLRQEMVMAFRAAVDGFPGHVGANTELLLEWADRGEWTTVLEGARSFSWASQGHPYARLLEGLALQRLGRSSEAFDRLAGAIPLLDRTDQLRFSAVPEGLAYTGPGDGGDGLDVDPWAALDPVLSTDVNERMVEHWARASYALLRFGSLEADAARVWLRFGRPLTMRAFGAGSGLRLELWDYGSGPDLTFYRPAATQNGALTPESEDYLLDLAQAFPGGVPGDFGRLEPLDASLRVIPGVRGAEDRVELTVPVPAPRAGGVAPEPLEVAVFFLNDRGVPIGSRRETVARGAGSLLLLTAPPAGARAVTVELTDPVTGRISGTRMQLGA